VTVTDTHAVLSSLAWRDYTEERFRALLSRWGYLHLHDLPEDFDHLTFLQRYGDLMPQYDGALVWSIQAQRRFDDLYHSLNTRPLNPHTECYEFEGVPPKYLALWCLKPAEDGGGQTTLADMYGFLGTLTDAERERLASRAYRYVSSAGVQDMELGVTALHSMVEYRPALPSIVRFSYNCVEHEDDPFLLDIRERVLAWFERTHVAVDYARGDILIWDNHRTVHSRTGYTDRGRHLRRVWLAES
jgi:alpha-ketoglutarate-dependent taurine dioxygenase